MPDWMAGFRAFGGTARGLSENWSYSSTPYLDFAVRTLWVVSAFFGFWLVLGILLASQVGPYVRYALILVAANVALLATRAVMRRR